LCSNSHILQADTKIALKMSGVSQPGRNKEWEWGRTKSEQKPFTVWYKVHTKSSPARLYWTIEGLRPLSVSFHILLIYGRLLAVKVWCYPLLP
jgi:hypothetical protein